MASPEGGTERVSGKKVSGRRKAPVGRAAEKGAPEKGKAGSRDAPGGQARAGRSPSPSAASSAASESATPAPATAEPGTLRPGAGEAAGGGAPGRGERPGGRVPSAAALFGAALLGGVLAGSAGVLGTQFLLGEGLFARSPSAVERLAAALEARESELAALRRQFEALQADLSVVADRVSAAATADELAEAGRRFGALESSVEALSEAIDALALRIAGLEARPASDAGSAAAYQRQFEALREMFRAELDRIEAARKSAVAARVAQETVAADAALAGLRAAAATGGPFSAELEQLAAAGLDVPQRLVDLAQEGIPTLAQLRADFAESARAALVAATREAAESGRIGRFEAFLRSQLGVRSLRPRAGDDPDAVLSRAEAALAGGDLQAALVELQALPDSGRREMAPWVERAGRRAEALRAIEALAGQLRE